MDDAVDVALTGRRVVVGLDFNFSFPQWATAFIGEPPHRLADRGPRPQNYLRRLTG